VVLELAVMLMASSDGRASWAKGFSELREVRAVGDDGAITWTFMRIEHKPYPVTPTRAVDEATILVPTFAGNITSVGASV
jgi:hypothetical protein